jgi:hypothetical protein
LLGSCNFAVAERLDASFLLDPKDLPIGRLSLFLRPLPKRACSFFLSLAQSIALVAARPLLGHDRPS